MVLQRDMSFGAALDAVLGPTPSIRDVQREHLRSLEHAARKLETTRTSLERQEREAVTRLRNYVYKRQVGEAKATSMEIADLKSQQSRIQQSIMSVKRAKGSIQQVTTAQEMSEIMHGTTRTLAACNSFMPAREVARTMAQYERSTAEMQDKQDLIDDSIANATDAGDQEADADEIFSSALDAYCSELTARLPPAELAQLTSGAAARKRMNPEQVEHVAEGMLSHAAAAAAAPRAKPAAAAKPMPVDNSDDEEYRVLEARLLKLKDGSPAAGKPNE